MCVATASVTESGSLVAANITGVRTLVSGLGVVHCIAVRPLSGSCKLFSFYQASLPCSACNGDPSTGSSGLSERASHQLPIVCVCCIRRSLWHWRHCFQESGGGEGKRIGSWQLPEETLREALKVFKHVVYQSKQAIFGSRVFSTERKGKVRPGIGEVKFQTDAEEPPHWFLFVHLPPKLGMAKAGMTNTIAVGIAVQSDWDNRQFSSSRSLNVHRLFEFFLQFGKPTKLFDIYVFLLLNSGTFLVSLSSIHCTKLSSN